MQKRNRLPRKIKKKIPEGQYCYEIIGRYEVYSDDFKQIVPALKTSSCPLYFYNPLGIGDCRYFYRMDKIYNGADDNEDLILGDQCKICNFNLGKEKYIK